MPVRSLFARHSGQAGGSAGEGAIGRGTRRASRAGSARHRPSRASSRFPAPRGCTRRRRCSGRHNPCRAWKPRPRCCNKAPGLAREQIKAPGGADKHVVPSSRPSRYVHEHWGRGCLVVGIEHRRPDAPSGAAPGGDDCWATQAPGAGGRHHGLFTVYAPDGRRAERRSAKLSRATQVRPGRRRHRQRVSGR